jgi:hypothetical protein
MWEGDRPTDRPTDRPKHQTIFSRLPHCVLDTVLFGSKRPFRNCAHFFLTGKSNRMAVNFRPSGQPLPIQSVKKAQVPPYKQVDSRP